MTLVRTVICARKSALLIVAGAFLVTAVAAQQNTEGQGWRIFRPNGASFSMQVPGIPLPAQGHIFDSNDEERAYRVIEHGLRSRIYNFEIEKDGERRFLVSILEVQTTGRRPHSFITDSEVELINRAIGDEIVHSRVVRLATENGEVTQWNYRRRSSGNNEDDGIVYVRRRGTCIVIVVVDYDYANAGDSDIKMMLDSLRVR